MPIHNPVVGRQSKRAIQTDLSDATQSRGPGQWNGDPRMGQKIQNAPGADRGMAGRIGCRRRSTGARHRCRTGMVYEPNLGAMLDDRKDKQCIFRVTDAGFDASGSVVILVRAQISTFYEPGDEEADVPSAKRCEKSEETWSFNFANGEIKRIANSEPLQIFKKFGSSRDKH